MAIKHLRSGAYIVKNYSFVARGGDDLEVVDVENEEDSDEDAYGVPRSAADIAKTQTVYSLHAYGGEDYDLYFTGEIVWSHDFLEVSAVSSGAECDGVIPALEAGCKLVLAVDED